MNMTGNTILITGGGSGIGLGLASALHAEGNTVIIAGRRKDVLDQAVAKHPGLLTAVLDVNDQTSIVSAIQQLIEDYPKLNVLINNAGIMRPENLLEQAYLADSEATINTNLLGPIRMIEQLLPHLQQQPDATIINITSGLAFVPLVITPTYNATKAAMHSYSQALRTQLKETNIQIIEIAPPAVATNLMGEPVENAMPLDDFITETISLLRSQPKAREVLVERVKFLRFAEANGSYNQTYNMLNGIEQ